MTLRVPRQATQKDIQKILKEKEPWIQKHIDQIRDEKARYEAMEVDQLTNAKIKELADNALKYIPERVAYFAKLIGVDYGHITIRNQRTRWGSCSSKEKCTKAKNNKKLYVSQKFKVRPKNRPKIRKRISTYFFIPKERSMASWLKFSHFATLPNTLGQAVRSVKNHDKWQLKGRPGGAE